MAKTNLYGFSKGAKQIVNYLSGQLITKKRFDIERDKLNKKYAGTQPMDPEYDKYSDAAGLLTKRLEVSYEYVAFMNYTKQLLDLNSRKEKGITREEINQLAANNRAVSKLSISGDKYFKYGSQSAAALTKYQQIIMANDYKKLQYICQFPDSALKNITLKDINNVSLPRSEYAVESDYDRLKHEMKKLGKRLEELDANRHVNSSEFKKMKAAVKALNKELEKPWRGETVDIGECLEALQEASMDYVQAKGVGRQTSQLGKDRMDLGLDLAKVSSRYMDKFISDKRIEAVENFERDVLHIKRDNCYIYEDFTSVNVGGGKTAANIFEDKERGINKYGVDIKAAREKLEYDDDFEDEDELDDDEL